MKIRLRFLARILLLAGMCFSTELSAGENYIGVWYGTVFEMVAAGKQYQRYDVTVTVAPKDYRIDYDMLECGGNLRLLIHRGRFYRFKDELHYGQEHCDGSGHTEIHFINSDLAAFQWFDKSGVLKVEGHLKRQAQLII
jgi:hypothetical protein